MTTLATLIGLIPMATKLGTGSEAYAPLARAIIGGLAVSVVPTVFLVPAGYLLIHERIPRRRIPGPRGSLYHEDQITHSFPCPALPFVIRI